MRKSIFQNHINKANAHFKKISTILFGFPGSSAGKESACNAGDPSLIPGSGRFPGVRDRLPTPVFLGFPGGSDSKESACNVADLGSAPGLGRAPGGGHGNLLQYSCLENPMDTPVFLPGKSHGQRSYRPWGCKELGITERLSTAQHSAEH